VRGDEQDDEELAGQQRAARRAAAAESAAADSAPAGEAAAAEAAGGEAVAEGGESAEAGEAEEAEEAEGAEGDEGAGDAHAVDVLRARDGARGSVRVCLVCRGSVVYDCMWVCGVAVGLFLVCVSVGQFLVWVRRTTHCRGSVKPTVVGL
jgi:hypothetical protein